MMANTSEFSTEQVFRSRDDLKTWVQNVARSQGYVIVTKRSKTINFGNTSKIELCCDRGGTPRNKDSVTIKINCPFEVVGKYFKAFDGWLLRVVCDEHNHEPATYMEGHPYAMRLSDRESRLVQELTKLNVKPRDILSTLKEQNPNNVSSLTTVYNARHKFRMSEEENRSPMQNVMHILQSKGYDFEYSLNNITNELEDLFFMHPTSLKMWQAFPHVVFMDATYKTNKYNLPFLEIVGVTSTNKTFSIAFAFMRNKKTSNYKWALTCLKLTINESFCSRVIVTDRDLALMKACEEIFPQSNHLLCRWHIFNDITKHCRPRITVQKTWDSLHLKWKKLVESPTQSAYMQNYADLQTLLFKHPVVFGYLYNSWLNKYADRFVSLWTDKHINFGNSTTNRVESQHAKLKKHLDSAKCDLDRFIHVIEKVVQSQETAIKENLERCKITRKPKFKSSLFQELRGLVSLHAMDKILEELHRPKGFLPTPENCGCQLRTCFGLPCAHELAIYVGADLPIPLDSIDVFWRKLNLDPLISVEYSDLTCDPDIQRFKEFFNNQSDHEKFVSLRRLRGITDPSNFFINEPSVKKNNRGRPKVKRAQRQTQVPHRYSCSDINQEMPTNNSFLMDLNEEPSRHSSFCIDLNEEPTRHNSFFREFNGEPIGQCSYQVDEPIAQCSYQFDLNEEPPVGYNSLLNEIPTIFHPYITNIEDVDGDGNCGFRSVAACLGYGQNEWLYVRRELLDELLSSYEKYAKVFYGIDEVLRSLSYEESPVSRDGWMRMPETGILIANRFGVILHFLTNEGSITCFPLWKGPEEFPSHHAITIALVYAAHYVMVRLDGEYPMPRISALWIRHKDPSAIGWQSVYKSRLKFYEQLKPATKSFLTLED